MDPIAVDPLVDGYGLDANGDTIGNVGTGLDSSGANGYGVDTSGDTIGNIPPPDVFTDPGASSGGSVTASGGGSGSGGSGFGTFLSGLGNLAGGFFRGASGGGGGSTPTGRTAAGAPCVLGTAGCAPATAAGSSSQTTMMVLVGVGAIVLIIALRGK